MGRDAVASPLYMETQAQDCIETAFYEAADMVLKNTLPIFPAECISIQ